MRQSIKTFSKILVAFFALFLLTVSAPVFAAEPFFIEGSVEVKPGCEVEATDIHDTDSDGAVGDVNVHVFPKEDSPGKFLGVCAISAAKQAGIINSFAFNAYNFGLFLDSINGVKTSDDWDKSWSLYHNGTLASVGLADLVVVDGDEISLIYTSFSSGEEFDKVVLHISIPQGSGSARSGGGSAGVADHYFSAEKAIQYLASRQSDDGSIENALFTDWSAIAFGAYNSQHKAVPALKNYLIENPDPGESLGPAVLSFTRRAMALMALGINPYFGTDINYIQKIIEAFDGEQIGDPKLVNDDIFALLVLRKAGYNSSDEIVRETTRFILQKQREDGSWQGGVDMTAAAIQTLTLLSDIQGVKEALAKAKTYLLSQQQADGGFGNPEATSWVLQAGASLGEDWKKLEKNGNSPGSYLFHFQRIDGSLLSATPVWSTAYAVPASLGKSWGDILQDFDKEEQTARLLETSLLGKIARALKTIEDYVEMLQASVGLLITQ